AEKKDLKIGIIGIGVLGSVVEKFFKEKGHQVYCHEGWKGLCLLKDTEALFNWAKKRGVNLSVPVLRLIIIQKNLLLRA
ncbi:MAG: hypothetical protein UV10_C0024G0009, partial [Candidatus Azambacteria bacterium GW2011_GWA1_42_19]